MQPMQSSLDIENDYYRFGQGKKMKVGNLSTNQFSSNENKKFQTLQKIPFGRQSSENKANGLENMVNGSRFPKNQTNGQKQTLTNQSSVAPLSTKFYKGSKPRATPRKSNQDVHVPEITPLFQGKEDGILVESPTSGKWKQMDRSSSSQSYSQQNTLRESFAETPNSYHSHLEVKEVSPSPISGHFITNPTLHSRVEGLSERAKKLKVIQEQSQEHHESELDPLIKNILKDETNPEHWYAYVRREYKTRNAESIINIIDKAIEKIPEENKSNPYYSHLFIAKAKCVEDTSEKLAIFKDMMKKSIGIKNAVLYIHWAFVEQGLGHFERSVAIIHLGLKNGAQPAKDLEDFIRTHNNGSFHDHSYSSSDTNSTHTYEHSQQQSTPITPITTEKVQVNPKHSIDHKSLIAEKDKWEKVSKVMGTKNFYINEVPYLAISILGQGGSGKVYQVLSPKFRIYALKIIQLEDESIQQYIDEVKMLEGLKGKTDHIIEIIDYELNTQLKKLSILFECAETDLNCHLKDKTGMVHHDLTSLKFYWKAILHAVAVVHSHDIVHGDLKPSNFVLVKGQLKLIDFGLAKAIENDTVNIRREHLAGTLNFMAPEAVSGDGTSGHALKMGLPSDIWSLGCILYQMVYGYSPFYHIKETVKKLACIVNPGFAIPFQSIGNKRDHHYLLDVLKSCLNRDAKKRPNIEQLLKHPFLEGD